MNENNGYLKLSRSITDSEVWCDSNVLKLWLLCLTKARYKNGHTLINGKKVVLKQGEFITGRESLYKEFNKGVKKKQIVSESTLWNWIKNFEKSGKLNIKSTNKYSVITILNWNKYQDSDESLTSNEHQLDNNLTSTEQQVDITLTQKKKDKKEKKDKKDKKDIKAFKKPTLSELQIFVSENNLYVDCEAFLDYYDANGWLVGKAKMKDWKATARNWSRRNGGTTKKAVKYETEDTTTEEERQRLIKEIEERRRKNENV